MQAHTSARQPIGKGGKGKKGKSKGKGRGTPAMPLATSSTFEELLASMPQDTCPYLVTELWQAAGCPSTEVGDLAATPVLGVAGEEWVEPSGCRRWTGEPLVCHRGDACSRARCVFHHSLGQTVEAGADYTGGGADGLHAMLAQLEASVAGQSWDYR